MLVARIQNNVKMYILTLFIIFIIMLFACKKTGKKCEKFEVNEKEIAMVSKMYNDDKITSNNLKVSENSDFYGNVRFNNNLFLKGDSEFTGEVKVINNFEIEKTRYQGLNEVENKLNAPNISADDMDISNTLIFKRHDIRDWLIPCVVLHGKKEIDYSQDNSKLGIDGDNDLNDFNKVEFGGSPYVFLEGDYKMLESDIRGSLNSIRVAPGYEVEIYEKTNFRNLEAKITGPYQYKIKNGIESLKVRRIK